MGALAGMLGSMMALEAIREIVGFGESLVGRLVMVDARAMRFETLRYARDPANPLNGDTPTITDLSGLRGVVFNALSSPLLAVHMRKLRLGIARAGGGAGRKCLGERGEMRLRQFHVERAERLGKAVAATCADQRDDVVALRGDPGDRDLRR